MFHQTQTRTKFRQSVVTTKSKTTQKYDNLSQATRRILMEGTRLAQQQSHLQATLQRHIKLQTAFEGSLSRIAVTEQKLKIEAENSDDTLVTVEHHMTSLEDVLGGVCSKFVDAHCSTLLTERMLS